MDSKAILRMLFAAFWEQPVSEETVATYVLKLKDVPPADLERAVNHFIDNAIKLPKIAEILAQVTGEGTQKFLPAPPKTYDQLDEERAGRPVIDRDEEWKTRPDPFPTGFTLYRESKEERLERLRRTQDWGPRYAN